MGSGSQSRTAGSTQGRRVERRVAAQDQVGQGASGQVGCRDAVAHIAAGPGDPRTAIQTHARAPVARHAQHAAPGVVDPRLGRLRQQPAQHGVQPRDGPRLGEAGGVDPGAETIGDAAAADGDAPLAGSLGVAVDVRGVPQKLAAVPADSRPDSLRQGFGDDDGAVERQQTPLQARKPGGEAFGRPHDKRGADHAPVRGDPAGIDAAHGRSVHRSRRPAAPPPQPGRAPAWPAAPGPRRG